MTFSMEILDKTRAREVLPRLFDLLYANMCPVVGMDGGYAAEKERYLAQVLPALQKPARQIVLMRAGEELIGFFQYYENETRFMMEEIQLLPRWQGSGAFRALFEYLMPRLRADTPFVEAFVHVRNHRSQAILRHLGLAPTAEGNDECLHFRGEFRPLRAKYTAKSEVRIMKILVMNGPNLNLLGKREPDIYGKNTYNDLLDLIRAYAGTRNVEVSFFQSNHEGALVDAIQEAMGNVDGIVINPGAYTHTSVALLDAVKGVGIPTVEVHISDPDTREEFRHVSFVRAACIATVKGKGFQGYLDAIDILIQHIMK